MDDPDLILHHAGIDPEDGGFPEEDAPLAPLAAPALHLRSASISSLDECSQRCRHDAGLNSSLCSCGKVANWGANLPSFSFSSSRPQHRVSGHAPRTLQGLDHLRRGGNFTDVTLVAGDVEVKAHKNVLASCSPYFYAMFTGFEESRMNRVNIKEIDPTALVTLIDYVYTAKVEVNEDNVQSLLMASNLLQLVDVRDVCCDFLYSQLHPSNCLGIKEFADTHGCTELKAQAVNYIENRFTEVLESDEFLQLKPKQVIELISSDTITIPTEEKVYESVLTWVEYDATIRQEHLPALMAHVRLPLLSKEYLIQKVDTEGLMDECKDYVIEALKFHLAHGDPNKLKPDMLTSVRAKPRQPVGLPKVLLAIGGQAPKAIRSVECYDFKEERWFTATDMDTRRCRCGVAVVRGKVYAVGGFNGSLRVRTVDMYDPLSDRWSGAPSMEARRSTLGVAVLNDHIYAVGGFDGSTGLNTAEVLDLSDPSCRASWRSISSMSTRRSSVGVGVLNGMIYAVGGYDGNSRHCLASVEVYNPDSDTWTEVCDMSARRSGAGVGILNGYLYAVGGHDGPLVRKSVECYNPDQNIWTSASDMNFCRRNAGVVAHNGQLFVVGGDDGTANLQSVEMYNPKTDTWIVLPGCMNIGRSYTGICVVDKPEFMASM